VDSTRIPHDDHDDTVEAHYSGLERLEAPHACIDGTVYIGFMIMNPETGDDLEVIEAAPCRRCADSR